MKSKTILNDEWTSYISIICKNVVEFEQILDNVKTANNKNTSIF